MKKFSLFLFLLVLMISGIGIVSAEGFSSQIVRGTSDYLINYTLNYAPDAVAGGPTILYLSSAEATTGMRAIIHYIPGAMPHSGSANSAQTAVTGTIGNYTVFTGEIGYQNVFSGATFLYAYVFITTDNWNIGSYTGNQNVVLNYNASAVNNMAFTYTSGYNTNSPGSLGNPLIIYGSGIVAGLEQTIITTPAINVPFSFTRPNAIGGASGSINKNLTAMALRAVVYSNDDISGGDSIANNNPYTNVTLDSLHGSNLKVGIFDSLGNLIGNSSVFFAGAVPGPSPTTTPDINGPIPAGMVRSQFQCVDSKTSGHVADCDVSINNEATGEWSNVTGRFDGTWFIDTYPGAELSGYGSATGYSSASRLHVPASGSVMYELILQPGNIAPAPSGKVFLYFIVSDDSTGTGIYGAEVTVNMFMDSTLGTVTNPSGSAQLTVKNNTAYYATADKAGYNSVTISGITSDYGPDTRRIIMQRVVVTAAPTSTPVQGEVTARPTADTRTSGQKDQAMMDLIRNNAENIIQIALLMTIIYLVSGAGRK